MMTVDTTTAPCHHGGMTSQPRHSNSAQRGAVALTVRLPAELTDALRNYAFVTDTSANDVVKRAVADFLKAHGHTEMVRAAFEKALDRHAIAFDKLADL
jgi:predicted transcriptional regulator